jgi:hypothetical protein
LAHRREERESVADIFISYTSSDRDWAYWIEKELKALGHTPHIHEWEVNAGDDIYKWMEERHDHVLCVMSDQYLKAPFSTLERNAALWQAADKRPGFVLLRLGPLEPSRAPPERRSRNAFRRFSPVAGKSYQSAWR